VNELLVDVSDNNVHPLPWDELIAAGVKGVIVKCTEGTTYVNPDCAGDVAEARARGLGVSAYHFFHPELPALAQVGWLGQNLPEGIQLLWCDVETSGGLDPAQVASDAHAFLAAIPNHFVRGPYLDLSELSTLPEAPWGFMLWLADPSHPANPQAPCLIQQFGQQSIGGQTFDVNRFNGTDAQFAAVMFPPAQQPPGPAPAPTPAPVPAPPPPPPAPAPAPTGGFMPETVQMGSFSGAVKNVQRLLNATAGQSLAVDGIFGSLTETAVKNYQKVFKLTEDGIVGPVTWSTLDTFG
jgi:peptidoglycan hydrolase-like protein with peptidoglycan-binding domain